MHNFVTAEASADVTSVTSFNYFDDRLTWVQPLLNSTLDLFHHILCHISLLVICLLFTNRPQPVLFNAYLLNSSNSLRKYSTTGKFSSLIRIPVGTYAESSRLIPAFADTPLHGVAIFQNAWMALTQRHQIIYWLSESEVCVRLFCRQTVLLLLSSRHKFIQV